ncbi:HPr family phosphocarrier protein [Ammoniphilus sp. 3BR4]|uniref:HPr family phosphocarrier protein n=1 Tax=Ammoniphilus sp. 3BR4 TaxID=3158265 RepID=UPI0034663290
MVQEKVLIKLKNGLQSRQAAFFVQEASRFASEIYIEDGNKKLNAKSIIGVMSLAVRSGSEVIISAKGSDAMDAVKSLKQLVSKEG